jgi:hypothetical protein
MAATLLEEDDAHLPPAMRRALGDLLQSHRSLEGEVSRLRMRLQEWIVSQLTYKALYYRYSGQTPESPRDELMREKDRMRRTIQDQLDAGADHTAILGQHSRSLSKL